MSLCHRFGRFEVRPAQRQLLIDGQPAALGARAYDVLLALIECRDRVVGKNELLDRVWAGVVVEENNLQVQVSTLRRLLGPRAIATVPGRGYRFTLLPDGDGQPAGEPAVQAESSVRVAAVNVLPALPGGMLGRDDELAALEQLLRQHRLITVLGAGGIGKTTLALAVAHALRETQRDGAAWVALADVSDASLAPAAAAQALQLTLGSAEQPLPALVTALAPLQVLLVLDNAEHLLDAAAGLAPAVLAGAPGVRLLVTSQAPLRVAGERVFRLGALAVPEARVPADEALSYGAVALFADQAKAADRHFELTDANAEPVISLCRHLDGMALAIKLAAARLPLLGLQGLEARLGESLKLLGGNSRSAPTRQQTLRAALDWSHGLLDAQEQAVFRRLGVFAGGFTLALASAVASDEALDEWAVIDTLGALVDRSLVAAEGNAQPRYRLPESVREYAREKLDASGEQPRLQRQHAQATALLMDEACASYWAMPDAPWLAAFAPEIDNVRAALDWSARHEPALAVATMGASSALFLLLGLAPEARRRFQALQAVAASLPASNGAARFWMERSRLHWGISSTLMHEFASMAMAAYRDAGDDKGLYLSLRCVASSGALTPDQAQPLIDEMTRLERADWPPRVRSQRLLALASVLRSAGRLDGARDALVSLLDLAGASGLDLVAAFTQSGLAETHLALGNADEAVRLCRELVSARRHRKDNLILQALATLAGGLLVQGQVDEARGAIAELLATSRSRDWEWLGLHADLCALLAAREGRVEAAARLLGYADAAQQRAAGRVAGHAAARAQAGMLIQARLDERALARLGADGAHMDPEAVCALTLTLPEPVPQPLGPGRGSRPAF